MADGCKRRVMIVVVSGTETLCGMNAPAISLPSTPLSAMTGRCGLQCSKHNIYTAVNEIEAIGDNEKTA